MEIPEEFKDKLDQMADKAQQMVYFDVFMGLSGSLDGPALLGAWQAIIERMYIVSKDNDEFLQYMDFLSDMVDNLMTNDRVLEDLNKQRKVTEQIMFAREAGKDIEEIAADVLGGNEDSGGYGAYI